MQRSLLNVHPEWGYLSAHLLRPALEAMFAGSLRWRNAASDLSTLDIVKEELEGWSLDISHTVGHVEKHLHDAVTFDARDSSHEFGGCESVVAQVRTDRGVMKPAPT